MSGSSRLSSLLVRDGIIGVKRMEQAFQRQVIYGGALDTILMEMGAVTEERLSEYLSLSAGLPPAERNLLDYFDPRAVQVCPREVAEEFHVVPVAFDADALRVLVTDPVDLTSLELLATRIGAPIQPFVVPEFRFNLLVERLFGVPAPSRFQSLASRQAAAKRPPRPEPKVIVDDVDIRRVAETPNVRTRTSPMSTDTVQRAVEKQEQQRRLASSGQSPPVAPVAPAAPSRDSDTTPRVGTPRIETADPAAAPRLTAVPVAIKGVERTHVLHIPWHTGGNLLDPSPLEPRVALGMLRDASERDDIFHTLIRGVRSRTRYAATLVVQGDTAFGREAIHSEGADVGITQVAISLAQTPAFQTAVNTASPYVGPVGTGSPPADATLARLGGIVPPSALLLPVSIRGRVVALVYAHRGTDAVSAVQAAEVLPLASEAGMALSRLILRTKATGYRTVREEPSVKIDFHEVPSRQKPANDTGKWRRVTDPAVPMPVLTLGDDELAAAMVDSGPLQRTPIDVLLGQIEAGGDGAAEAYDEALRRADEALVILKRKLPGKLWVDRYGATPRLTRASQHGPLLALLVRIGDRAIPLLAELITSDDREVRYYATLACGEVRSPALAAALAARLFDHDYGVRGAAVDALLAYPHRELELVLEGVRVALHGDAARARAASHALGELRDVGSIPDLIGATDRDHTTAEEARRALISITKHDFGVKSKKWRAWWEKNKDRPRVEWMLDGLAHPVEEIRHSASEELKRLTGEYFGYHYDLPKREREEARAKWVKWWEEVGRRRFLKNGIPEAQRSTAVLPGHMPKKGE